MHGVKLPKRHELSPVRVGNDHPASPRLDDLSQGLLGLCLRALREGVGADEHQRCIARELAGLFI